MLNRAYPSLRADRTLWLPEVQGGLWLFNEGGAVVYDAAGYHVASTKTGTITPRSAPISGSALEFTTGSKASYLDVGVSKASANLGPCTIAALVKRTGTGYGIVWDRSDGNNVNTGIQIQFLSATGDKLRVAVVYSSTTMHWNCTAPALDEWHLITMTWTGVQGAGYALYIDGVDQSASLGATGGGARGDDSSYNAYWGGTSRTAFVGSTSYSQTSLDGQIALGLVDRRVWSQQEIAELYARLDDIFVADDFWTPAPATSPPPPPPPSTIPVFMHHYRQQRAS